MLDTLLDRNIRLFLEGQRHIAHCSAALNSVMLFPHDPILRKNAYSTFLVETVWADELRRQTGDTFTIDRNIVKDFQIAVDFRRHTEPEMHRLAKLGERAGWIMHFLGLLRVRQDEVAQKNPAIANEPQSKPSYEKARAMAIALFKEEEQKTGKSRQAYSPKKMDEAWQQMMPVAHFWAADNQMPDIIKSEKWQAKLLRHPPPLHPMLQLQQRLYLARFAKEKASGIIPHARSEPIYNPELACWVGDVVDKSIGSPDSFELGEAERIDIGKLLQVAHKDSRKGRNKPESDKGDD